MIDWVFTFECAIIISIIILGISKIISHIYYIKNEETIGGIL